MKVTRIYTSDAVNTFNVVDSNGVLIAYYYEYFCSPIDGEKLENVVYEIYYDFEDANDSSTSTSSAVFDDVEDFEEFLYDLMETA